MIKILVFSDTYLPGYKGGGPVKSIKNILMNLDGEFEFWVFTRDRDLGDDQPYADIQKNKWLKLDNVKVFYATPDQLTMRNMAKVINKENFDILYINSFFNFTFSIKPLLEKKLKILNSLPLIVAPRGEFSPGALQIKAFKKKLFIKLSKMLGLHKSVSWQATTDIEKQDIIDVLGVNEHEITVAKNLPSKVEAFACADNSEEQKLKMVFLSRISPKKNLYFALEILNKCNSLINFDIYGPVEDKEYWQQCNSLIEVMPDNVVVKYRGEVAPVNVSKVFLNYDLFIFPTRGENYGHVIAESLSVGTPVMLSDQTPWRNLENDGLGWDIPLSDIDRFVESVDTYYHKVLTSRDSIRKNVLEGSHKRIFNAEDVEATKNMFLKAVAR